MNGFGREYRGFVLMVLSHHGWMSSVGSHRALFLDLYFFDIYIKTIWTMALETEF